MTIYITATPAQPFFINHPVPTLQARALDESERRTVRMLHYQKTALLHLQIDTAFEHALAQAQKAEVGEETKVFYKVVKTALAEADALLEEDDSDTKPLAQYTLQREETYLFRLAAMLLQKNRATTRKVYELKWLHLQASIQAQPSPTALRMARQHFETELLQYLRAVEATPQEQIRFRSSQLRRFRQWVQRKQNNNVAQTKATETIAAKTAANDKTSIPTHKAATLESTENSSAPQLGEQKNTAAHPLTTAHTSTSPPTAVSSAALRRASALQLVATGAATRLPHSAPKIPPNPTGTTPTGTTPTGTTPTGTTTHRNTASLKQPPVEQMPNTPHAVLGKTKRIAGRGGIKSTAAQPSNNQEKEKSNAKAFARGTRTAKHSTNRATKPRGKRSSKPKKRQP